MKARDIAAGTSSPGADQKASFMHCVLRHTARER